jgi:hypothetical protein
VPVATSCWVWPTPRDNVPVTAIDFNVGETVTVADPETPLRVAVMVLVPALTAVTAPPAEMLATAVLEEDQVTDEVRF